MRLIDAEALIADVENDMAGKYAAFRICTAAVSDLKWALLGAPAVDTVHAAGGCYCRECKFYLKNMGGCSHPVWNEKGDFVPSVKPDDFCSRGVKKRGLKDN